MSTKFYIISLLSVILLTVIFQGCGKSAGSQREDKENDRVEEANSQPLNLTIFVDLSDRIEKEKDKMIQAEKDRLIINALANGFIEKQIKEGFQKSKDCFQVIFYPAPLESQTLADNLNLDLGSIVGPKKKDLNDFKSNYEVNVKSLYDKALNEKDYFGSDIWGYFNKDKVKDFYKDGYRNVLVILSDGYIYDANNKLNNGLQYSYILPQTLAVKDSELIPCEISNPNFELFFMECNPNPQTDFPKMKSVLNNWFTHMGINKIDIQDTDLPANTIKHLEKDIFH
ncbi:MAG: hypothetical protein K2M31_02265 [Muribaculaceae bacterium]|nr:hypothetical protein [Muribaculaceae bacterium]